MNKIKHNFFDYILVRSAIYMASNIFCLIIFNSVYADNIIPEVQTQVNKRTDLFQKSIGNEEAFKHELNEHKLKDTEGLGNGENSMPKGLSLMSDKNQNDLTAEKEKLANIHENDLDSKGKAELGKNNNLNELYMDYSRPLNKKHMKDAKDLASAQDGLLKTLLEQLKKEGVDIDCKTVKGDKKHEPEFFLQTKTTTFEDHDYHQKFCEELRNQYNCHDKLTLKCMKTGMKWDPWENRSIEIDGPFIYHNHIDWMYSHKWRRRHFGHHLHGDPGTQVKIRAYIAQTIGASIDNIDSALTIKQDSFSIFKHIVQVSRKGYVWPTYKINYKYRDGYKICEEWAETWTEECTIK